MTLFPPKTPLDTKIEIVKRVSNATKLVLKSTNREFNYLITTYCDYKPLTNWVSEFSLENGALFIWYINNSTIINHEDYYSGIISLINTGTPETTLEWMEHITKNHLWKKYPHFRGISATSWVEDMLGEFLWRVYLPEGDEFQCNSCDMGCVEVTAPYPCKTWMGEASRRNSKKYKKKICSRWMSVIDHCLNFMISLRRLPQDEWRTDKGIREMIIKEIAKRYEFDDRDIVRYNNRTNN